MIYLKEWVTYNKNTLQLYGSYINKPLRKFGNANFSTVCLYKLTIYNLQFTVLLCHGNITRLKNKHLKYQNKTFCTNMLKQGLNASCTVVPLDYQET